MTTMSFTPTPRTAGRLRRGFTLIEVLVALTVLAVVLPVAMQGVSIVLQLGADAKHRAEAATLAQGKLDELTATNAWQSGELSGSFSESLPAYHWTATVQPWGDGTMDEVTVEVSWTARQRQKSVIVGTLVAPETQQ